MRKRKHANKTILKAIKGSYGLISTIAQRLQVSRKTVYNYLKESKELRESLEEESENVLDFVESKLMKKINDEDSGAIKYYLSSKGRKRGYSKEPEAIPSYMPKDEQKPFSWFDEGTDEIIVKYI